MALMSAIIWLRMAIRSPMFPVIMPLWAAARLLPGLGLALRESTARRECGRDQEA